MGKSLEHSDDSRPFEGQNHKGIMKTLKRMNKGGFYYTPDLRVEKYFDQVDPEDFLTTLYSALLIEDMLAGRVREGLVKEREDDFDLKSRIADTQFKLEILSRLVKAFAEPIAGQTSAGSLNREGLAIEKEIREMGISDKEAYLIFTENIADLLISKI